MKTMIYPSFLTIILLQLLLGPIPASSSGIEAECPPVPSLFKKTLLTINPIAKEYESPPSSPIRTFSPPRLKLGLSIQSEPESPTSLGSSYSNTRSNSANSSGSPSTLQLLSDREEGSSRTPTSPDSRSMTKDQSLPSTLLADEDKIGKVVSTKILGTGATKNVYEVTVLKKDGTTATYAAYSFAGSGRNAQRQLHELKIIDELHGIPGVISQGELIKGKDPTTGQPIYTNWMKVLKGGTLSSLIKGGPIPAEKIKSITKKLCTSMAEMHKRGVIHRDFKPANVFMDGDEPIIADFDQGYSKDDPYTRSEYFLPKSVSIAYAHPLFFKSGSDYTNSTSDRRYAVDEKHDWWGLGTSLLELINQKTSPWQTGEEIDVIGVTPKEINAAKSQAMENLRKKGMDPKDVRGIEQLIGCSLNIQGQCDKMESFCAGL